MNPLFNKFSRVDELDDSDEGHSHLMHATHGGNLTAAAHVTGMERSDLLDFSVNVNPLGPPSCVDDICSQSIRFLKEYPDPQYSELKKALADAVGVSKDCITVGNGSMELIYLLPHLINRAKEVLIVSPCFSEYEQAFQQTGISVRNFTLHPSNGFSLPLDKFLFHLKQYPDLGGIVIGHPNNPTGNLLDEESFKAISNFCTRHGIFLFIDETFIDFSTPNNSFVKYIASNPYLIVIRSMTKFFSLPGLRLGFGIMNPERVRKLNAHQPPWSVNGLAQAIGTSLVQAKTFSDNSRNYIQQENNFIYEYLKEVPAIEVFQSKANFVLFRLRDANVIGAKRFFKTLLYQGILLRNCGNFIGLDQSFFRLAVRSRNDNQLLLSRIHEYFQLNGA
jgi:threonine-phosphate decarboxylase